ncbi:hypothetical protein [Phyllobacterium sp. SB3]|uniref:hypothetical protein n=1 Tax=Phyllobacterium sp. SB3 TaxID=3156073 RepID=UPI0032AEE268
MAESILPNDVDLGRISALDTVTEGTDVDLAGTQLDQMQKLRLWCACLDRGFQQEQRLEAGLACLKWSVMWQAS